MKSPNFLKPFQLSTVMSYIEHCYHSNDEQFRAIMVDVLTLAKLQVKLWKDERVKLQKEHEAKATYEEFKSSDIVSKETQFINVTEKIGREEMSRMIGDKVIGKVFDDNLADF